jgi:hypothetical protein
MKLLVYTLEILLFLFLSSQMIMAALIRRTEQQTYTVISEDNNVQVRYYPESVLASVRSAGGYDQAANSGFRQLAGYIFGGNQSNERIAMTAPVWMATENDSMQMSFVMPAGYSLDNLPVPDNESVRLHTSNACTMAVIRFGGYMNDARIAEKANELREWLRVRLIAFIDEPMAAGYNPPFQLIGRRNEVAFRLVK